MTRVGWTAWSVAVALLAVAGVVRAATPDADARTAPFVVTAAMGEQGIGRDLAITVTEVRRASAVTSDDVDAAGNWLVVDLDAAAVVTEPAAIGSASFVVDGLTYTASERFPSFVGVSLAIDLPVHGQVAFELAPGLHQGTGVLAFALSGDTRLDSVVQVPIDLGALPQVATIALDDPYGTSG